VLIDPPDGLIFMAADGSTVLRFSQNGDIFVKDRLAENDKEVVSAIRSFLGILG
jgi:hypothetical protein